MKKKIIGCFLLSLPFIAITLLPLYRTDVTWSEVGIGFGIAFGGVIAVMAGIYLIIYR